MKQPGVDQNDVDRAIQVVSAYVGNNHISADDLPKFIEGVFGTVARLSASLHAGQTQSATGYSLAGNAPTADGAKPDPATIEAAGLVQPPIPAAALTPAVPIENSVHRDHLVCLEDGRSFKSLKRHLKTGHDLTPEQYRQKWALAFDYPMVAAEYAEARSFIAKDLGFGRSTKPKRAAPKVANSPPVKPRRGRPPGSGKGRSSPTR